MANTAKSVKLKSKVGITPFKPTKTTAKSAGITPDYRNVISHIGDSPDARTGWMNEDQLKDYGFAKAIGDLNEEYAVNAFNREMDASNTAHQREVADLKSAGLNPVLSAGGNGASTPNASTATSGESYATARQQMRVQKAMNKYSADMSYKANKYATDQNIKLQKWMTNKNITAQTAMNKYSADAGIASSGIAAGATLGSSQNALAGTIYSSDQAYQLGRDTATIAISAGMSFNKSALPGVGVGFSINGSISMPAYKWEEFNAKIKKATSKSQVNKIAQEYGVPISWNSSGTSNSGSKSGNGSKKSKVVNPNSTRV